MALEKQKIHRGLKWVGGTVATAVIGVLVANAINGTSDSAAQTEIGNSINIQNNGENNTISIGGDVFSGGKTEMTTNVDVNGDVIMGNKQVTNIYHSAQWRDFESRREKLKQNIAKYPNDLDFHQELNELEKQMQSFKQEVIQLAKQLQQTPINTERFKRAIKYFEKGEYKLANEVLNEQDLANEQATLLEEKAENAKKLQDNAAEFILKAKLTAIDYSLKAERIPQTEALFEKALVSDRSAQNLFEYGVFLHKNNQFSKANTFYQEALAQYRELAKQNPAVYLPDVAISLNSLANLVSDESPRRQEAEEYYQEALKLCRELAEQNPAVYLSYVADSLNNLAILVSKESPRRQEAEEYYQEALKLYRELAEQKPAVYLSDVATILNNLVNLVSKESPRWQEAEEYYQEALKLYRELAGQNPAVYLPYVAGSLNNLAALVSDESPRRQEAEEYYQEALKLRRELAEQNPAAYLPNVAMSLNNLAALVSDESSRRQEAEGYYQEALKIRRELIQQSPDQYSPDLAGILFNFAYDKFKWQENDQALKLLVEAESLIKPYAEQWPTVWGKLAAQIQELKKEINKK